MLMSSYHKAPEIWLKLQVKISSDCILTCVIDNLQEMGMWEYCKFEIPSLVPTSLFYPPHAEQNHATWFWHWSQIQIAGFWNTEN
jgi:hypothetical protein